jgi:hypothetical protein
MKSYKPTTTFITPPENQGQIVTVSYALAADDELILVRTYDASDRTTSYDAYAYPEECDQDSYDPANGEPELGAYVGQCSVDVRDDEKPTMLISSRRF